MVAPYVLVPAANWPRGLPPWGPRYILGALGIAGLLLLGALVIAIVDRWRKRPGGDKLSAGDQLSQFRSLYEQGELSSEEFAQIKGLLKVRMVQEMDLQTPPGKPPADPQPKGETCNGANE